MLFFTAKNTLILGVFKSIATTDNATGKQVKIRLTCRARRSLTLLGLLAASGAWAQPQSCASQAAAANATSPGRTSASHTKGVESIHWIACKEPAWSLDAEFVPGQGIRGRCYTVGGN
jgi:hypothetical protein